MKALGFSLAEEKRQALFRQYEGRLLWHAAAAVHGQVTGEAFPLPPWEEMQEVQPQSGEEIREELLRKLGYAGGFPVAPCTPSGTPSDEVELL